KSRPGWTDVGAIRVSTPLPVGELAEELSESFQIRVLKHRSPQRQQRRDRRCRRVSPHGYGSQLGFNVRRQRASRSPDPKPVGGEEVPPPDPDPIAKG